MPTTANFSLEYPDDNSSVDIAGHFETLADDVDAAINTRLALTGGTLTGSLSGTSLSLSSTLSVTGAITGTSTTDASSSTTGAIKTAGGMGVAKALYVGTTLNVTGATTLTGNVTINKASPSMVITGSGLSQLQITSTASNYAQIELSRAAGQWGATFVRTGSTLRWGYGVNGDAESGANAGSNFVFYTYNDAGGYLGNPITITRSTGAVTLTGTLNGKVVNDIVTGPASATDNALVRFDGTTGKVVQNSGITVDDSGNVTSDLTVSKASPTVNVAATSGHLALRLKAESGYGAEIYFTNNANNSRWVLAKSTTAETGSAAGSDLVLYRYNDAGSSLGINLLVTRSTGKWSFRDVGAAAGLELGSSGPRIMSGTGSPEGVVSAPVGSQWTDTAATTGAVKWIKASGTGNTGWVVSEGDTGSRDISSVLTADADRTLASTILLRRTGNRVVLSGVWRETTSSPNNRAFYSLPVGFRPAHTLYQYVPYDAANTTGYRNIRVPASGNITYGGPTSGSNYEYHVQWTTPDAWPSSLPGSAA